jgi:hypothetical protein
MSPMKPSAVSRSPIADPNRSRTGANADEPYIPHFRSLNMPGVASSPLLPEWLRKPFRERFRRHSTQR